MTISEVIKALEQLKQQYGDLPVWVYSIEGIPVETGQIEKDWVVVYSGYEEQQQRGVPVVVMR